MSGSNPDNLQEERPDAPLKRDLDISDGPFRTLEELPQPPSSTPDPDSDRAGDPPQENVVPGVEAAPNQLVQALAKKKRSAVWEWIETIVIALILALILRSFVVQPYEVHLSSMVPTLVEGDFILVSKLAYQWGTPQRGDVVVFMPPNGATNDYVKRVIGLPGETIDIQDGLIKINGMPLTEPWAHGQTNGGRYNHMVVPQGTVFCMGDNRLNSSDSRNFGPVSISALEGKVVLLFWPFTDFKWTF